MNKSKSLINNPSNKKTGLSKSLQNLNLKLEKELNLKEKKDKNQNLNENENEIVVTEITLNN